MAEGCERRSGGELTRFLNIARGSAVELENHLFLARDLEYVAENECAEFVRRADEVERMLTAFIKQVQPVKKSIGVL